MSYKERILDYLWSVGPHGATNGQIAHALGIRSQQTVYMTTQELAGRGRIRAAKAGAAWVFYSLDEQADQRATSNPHAAPTASDLRHRPVLNDEARDLLKVTRISGHKDCIVCQCDRSDA